MLRVRAIAVIGEDANVRQVIVRIRARPRRERIQFQQPPPSPPAPSAVPLCDTDPSAPLMPRFNGQPPMTVK